MDAVLQQGQAVLLEQFNTLLNKVGKSYFIVSVTMTTSAQTKLPLLQVLITCSIFAYCSNQNWRWGRSENEASPAFHTGQGLGVSICTACVFWTQFWQLHICSHVFQVLSSRRIDHDYALYLLLSLPEEHAVGKLQAIRSRSVSSYSKVIVSLLFYPVDATSIAMLRIVCRWPWQTMAKYGRVCVC